MLLSSTYQSPEQWIHTDHWQLSEPHFFSYKLFLQKQFGGRVQRVSVNGGFTCPNVDGTVASGGCVFCSNRSFSPSRRSTANEGPADSISDQLDEGMRRLRRRYADCRQYIAYFQPSTNTYAPPDRLRSLYDRASAHPQVVGLSIGTRPDCVPAPVLDLLSEVGRQTFLSVEYGMQTIHARSFDWMNRGHYHDAMIDAVERSRGRGFEIGAHIILGLPGESRRDMLETAREVARLNVDAVKIHNLYAAEHTPLADQVRDGTVQLIDRNSFVQSVVDALEVLPSHTVIQRMGGEAPGKYFVAPSWGLDKSGTRLAIHEEMMRRDTWQGKHFAAH